MQAELVVDCKNLHGEGVLWNQADSRVWWTDIEGRSLWSYDPASGKRVTVTNSVSGYVALPHAKPVV
jgi:sugar lactone lactonase YvrE